MNQFDASGGRNLYSNPSLSVASQRTSEMEGIPYRMSSIRSTTTAIITPQATKNVANAYTRVMDEVCNTVRDTFLDEGVEISVLQELRRLWENKVYESKVLEARSIAETRGSYNSMMPTHVPLQQGRMGMPQVYQVSTAGLSSSLPIRLPGNQTMPGSQTLPAGYRVVRPSQPQTAYSNQPYGGGGGQFIPQVDGARPATIVTNELVTGSATHDQPQDANVPPPRLLQLDGAKGQPQSSDDDSEDEFVEDTTGPQAKVAKMTSASSNKSQSEASSSKLKKSVAKKTTGNSDDGDDEDDDEDTDDDDSDDAVETKIKEELDDEDDHDEEEPLNSGDDVTDDETSNYPNSVSGAGEGGGVGGSSSTRTVFGCDDVVVCQFEKVRRQKNRWHLVLKDGIMNVQGRDVLFHRAEVDCEW